MCRYASADAGSPIADATTDSAPVSVDAGGPIADATASAESGSGDATVENDAPGDSPGLDAPLGVDGGIPGVDAGLKGADAALVDASSDAGGSASGFSCQSLGTTSNSPGPLVSGGDGYLYFAYVQAIAKVPAVPGVTPVVTEYSLAALNPCVQALTMGPDGNLWFTDNCNVMLGKIAPSFTSTAASVTEYPLQSFYDAGSPRLGPIAVGGPADTRVWFGLSNGATYSIGSIDTGSFQIQIYPAPVSVAAIAPNLDHSRIWVGGIGEAAWFDPSMVNAATAPTFTEYPIASACSTPGLDGSCLGGYTQSVGAGSLTAGPDGNMWFASGQVNADLGAVGFITPAGAVTVFSNGLNATWPTTITPGGDGNLWFDETNANKIGRATPAGVVTQFPVPVTANFPEPTGFAEGSDGTLWFTEVGDTVSGFTLTYYPYLCSIAPEGL
jgi:streptogramin lyase